MAELTSSDVSEFTGGRLEDTPELQNMLNAALVSARRDAGWHVNGVNTDQVVVLDGPDSRVLNLPTRKLIELSAVAEDGGQLDLASLRWSAGGPPGLLETPVRVRKRSKSYWSDEYQAISVTMTHGYTDEEAADWRHAVMSMVDRMAMVTTGAIEYGVSRKQVDDVAYTYGNPFASMADDMVIGISHILADYRLPPVEFI
jgi:hypothetical protein